jgi:hypothetical protein
VLSSQPAAIQLRYMQTLREIGAEQNSTIVFPLPIDLVKPLLAAAEQVAAEPAAAAKSLEAAPENGELPEGEQAGGLPRVALGGARLDSSADAEP